MAAAEMHDDASKYKTPKQGWLVAACNHAAYLSLQVNAKAVDTNVDATRVPGDGNRETPHREATRVIAVAQQLYW